VRAREARKAARTNDGDHVVLGLELPEGDIDGDTTLTLGLELVKNPRILEGTLAELSGFLLSVLAQSLAPISPSGRPVWRVEKRGESGSVLDKNLLICYVLCPSPALIREG
jgi:hypothetical protein